MIINVQFPSILYHGQIESNYYVMSEIHNLKRLGESRGPFLENPESFRVHFGWQILFVSSKPWRLEARNFVDILIIIPFTTCERLALQK